MSTDIESLRAECKRQIANIDELLASKYRPLMENAYRPHEREKLHAQYMAERTAMLYPVIRIWASLPPEPIILAIDEALTISTDKLDQLRNSVASDGIAATMVTWDGERFEHTPISMAEFYDLDPSNKSAN